MASTTTTTSDSRASAKPAGAVTVAAMGAGGAAADAAGATKRPVKGRARPPTTRRATPRIDDAAGDDGVERTGEPRAAAGRDRARVTADSDGRWPRPPPPPSWRRARPSSPTAMQPAKRRAGRRHRRPMPTCSVHGDNAEIAAGHDPEVDGRRRRRGARPRPVHRCAGDRRGAPPSPRPSRRPPPRGRTGRETKWSTTGETVTLIASRTSMTPVSPADLDRGRRSKLKPRVPPTDSPRSRSTPVAEATGRGRSPTRSRQAGEGEAAPVKKPFEGAEARSCQGTCSPRRWPNPPSWSSAPAAEPVAEAAAEAAPFAPQTAPSSRRSSRRTAVRRWRR